MPSPIAKGYAATPQGQVHFRRVEGPGTPIVLLHRTPVCSSSFERMLEFLAGKRCAIAFDTPGFGASFDPEGSPSTLDYANWFLAAATSLGLPEFHICAHHTGTHFAVEMARLAPQRVRSLLLSGVIYADAAERAKMRASIGRSDPIRLDGRHVSDCWKLMRSLFIDPDPLLIHAETLGALRAIKGRDQAFDAILAQDFGAVLRAVRCPVRIAQAIDDPLTLGGLLQKVRDDFPHMPVELLGAAFLAAPERQPGQLARALLAFTDESAHTDRTQPDMTESIDNRRFELMRSASGYDLVRADRPAPVPGPGEVLVRVRAVSINRRDLSIRDLSYPVNGADHFVPLSDAAGEIVAVGSGVSEWKVGDKVVSCFFQAWPDGPVSFGAIMSSLGAGAAGVLADHVVLSAGGITRMPAGWSFEEAACLPCAGVTAWSSLKVLGQLQPDDWVLVIGTGGVALFALQIAVASGAKVLVLSSSDEKLAQAKSMGAAAGVNYRKVPDWPATVKELTGGGVQHALELGGQGTLQKTVASMGFGGHVALIGALDGFGGDLSALPLVFSALRISAVMVGSRASQQALADFMVANRLRPVIDAKFDIANIEQAWAHANVGAFGKVVVSL